MQRAWWSRGRIPGVPAIVRCVAQLLLLGAISLGQTSCSAAPEPAPAAVVPPEVPFTRDPLDPPLRLTGNFGEYRSNHFHAGLDFSTWSEPCRPVYAPLAGYFERVRVSGAGYGRSLYLTAPDGRTLVFGHLDAFDEPLASYIAALQDSSGQYEQDLTFGPDRFPVAAGQRIAWSGESGAGPPHLHLEIRRGDMAFNPLRKGITIHDSLPPALMSVTLEPLDEHAQVMGRRGPFTARFREPADTVRVEALGRLRAIVTAFDPRADGAPRMAPYEVVVASGDVEVACRFDSVSWADDMPEVEYVYDRGRAAPRGRPAIRVWAPAGFRPRVFRSAEGAGESGTLVVSAGDPPRLVRVEAADYAGHRTARWLRLAPATAPVAAAVKSDSAAAPFTTFAGGEGPQGGPAFQWEAPAHAFFEPTPVRLSGPTPVVVRGELTPVSPAYRLEPGLVALRQSIAVRMAFPAADTAGVALYRNASGAWDYLGADYDAAAGRFTSDSRRFGRFALLRDRTAPRIGRVRVRPAPPLTTPAPYSRWSIAVRVVELGSGIDARGTQFVVDGRPVPSEWDSEAGTLRWRPRARPAAGTHRVQVTARDRMGNAARASATIVLN